MGRKENADIDRGPVHVLDPRLDVPVDLLADRRQRVMAPRRKRDPAMLHLRAAGEAKCVAHPERPAGLELLDDRGTAAEEGVAVALLLLAGDGLAQALIGRAIGRVDIVEIEAVSTLANMSVHVDHGMAVPAHGSLLSALGVMYGRPPLGKENLAALGCADRVPSMAARC